MRRHGCRPSTILPFASLLCVLLAISCGKTTSAADGSVNLISVGDCVSVTALGESDAAPVRRIPCGPPGTPFTDSAFSIYKVAIAHTLEVPMTTRDGADDLARLYCEGPEIIPGSSIYVFPTEASFAAGFKQFLCLVP
jgi:hypothetical protein